jgi:hypothetical protein
MTKRKPVSDLQNIWFDSEQVDDADLKQEQSYNTTIQSGVVNNHIGQGVLYEDLNQNVIFDSALSSGLLDGTNIQAQNQPVDTNFGNQLEVELTDSKASGRRSVKVAIIGLDFEGNLQYERYTFKRNEKIVGKKHFAQVLLLLFNDFVGPELQSFNLGGRIIIREAKPFTLSRDSIMVGQDIEPNIFFRDFFTTTSLTLGGLLTTSLPNYNVDNLNILTNVTSNKTLLTNDVSSQVGQKFLARTNNVQKVTLLLSVENTEPGFETDLAWTGDIVVSIYPLQTSIDCPTDIVPNLLIDFSPSNIPLAQISDNYSSLQGRGYQLDSVPQPIDFIFSNTPVASGNFIKPDTYYVVTIKRSGSADKCNILVAAGTNQTEDDRVTLFSGSLWTDIPEEDLWYQIWTDAAKVSDGQGYENGNGVIIPKTIIDSITGVTEDNSFGALPFTGNDVFRGVVTSVVENSAPIQDQRTGNPVNSRQQYVPNISLLNSIDIANLENVGEPLSIGAISDKNKKIFDATNVLILSNIRTSSIVKDEVIIRIFDDPDDPRFDETVSTLASNLLNGDLTGARIVTNNNNPSTYYRIADAQLCNMMVGDVDGNGLVDENDLATLNKLIGTTFNTSPPVNTVIVTDYVTTTFANGYTTQISPFVTSFGLTFQLVNPITNLVVADGYDGVLVAHPSDETLAQFTSATIMFNSIVGISDFKLVIITAEPANNGGFTITGLDTPTDVLTIRKTILSSETFFQMMRADLDGDGNITDNDGYLLNNYIQKLPFQPDFTYPFPGTNPYTNIGTHFNIIKLRLEKFVDRSDDYTSFVSTRDTDLHPVQDVFINDGYFASHDFLAGPSPISIFKQLVWEEQLVVTNSHPRPVPSVFTSQNGFNKFECMRLGEDCTVYPVSLEYDPGRIDYFVPNNLIIGDGGELHRSDGYFYKVDFEVGTIVLEIPDGLFGSERTINLIDDFISDYTGNGITRVGFPAMKFADCSYVQRDALAKDQLRFSVAVQSFSPNTNGLDVDGYEGVVVDGKMGVAIDYETGFLTLNFTNLYEDAVLPTLSTKVQVSVFLKKGGFNNQTVFIDSVKMQNMLKLISVFSGANVGGASALVDLQTDVTGVLPILHGGTGLNATGTTGTVLMSTGTSLSYQFVYNLPGVIAFSNGIPDADKVPKTDGYGKLDPSFYYKNPIYIPVLAGVASNDSSTPLTIGGFSFRFDKYILQGIQDIKLEAILETTDPLNTAQIVLFDNTNNTYITLLGMTTALDDATFISSQDLSFLLNPGATDFIYEVQLKLTANSAIETAICKMARLVITYTNPATAPPQAHSFNFQPIPIFIP